RTSSPSAFPPGEECSGFPQSCKAFSRSLYNLPRFFAAIVSLPGKPSDSVNRCKPLLLRAAEAILHQISVFRRVLVELSQDRNSSEAGAAKEHLSGKVRLAYFQKDTVAPLAGEFAHQLLHHLRAHMPQPEVGGDGEVKNVEPALVELVNHEADNPVLRFGDHADAVALPQTANKVLFGPRELKTLTFNLKHIGHIAPDHPADMHP